MVRIWVAKVMILLGSLEWIRNTDPLFTSSSYYSVLFSVQYTVNDSTPGNIWSLVVYALSRRHRRVRGVWVGGGVA